MRPFLILLVALATAASARAETPAKVVVTHFGRLLNADDTLATGTHRFTVRLYTERVVGASTDEKVWEDTFADVVLDRGVFKLDLGSGAPLDVSKFAGRAALYLTVAIDGGSEMLPRLSVGRVPFAAQAEAAVRASSADAVAWSGGTVALNAAGKWPAGSLEIPAGLVTVGENGRVSADVLPERVALLDANGRIPLDALPSGPSGLDSASVGGHTPSDATAGDKALAVLSGGKIPDAMLGANVPILTAGRLSESVLPQNVPLLNAGRLPESALPLSVPLLTAGRLSESVLPQNVPLLTAGRLDAATLPTGVLLSGQSAAVSTLTTTGTSTLGGALRIGYANEACTETTNGTLRFKDERLEICSQKNWKLVTTAPATGTQILLTGGKRRWSDGTVAKSCKEYRTPSNGFLYAGDTGSGLYDIKFGSGAITTYCDMDLDQGGWTLVFKWKSNAIAYPSGGNTNYNYFPQLATGVDTPMTRPDVPPASGDTEGLAQATRATIWTQAGAVEYRVSSYDGSNTMVLDIKKDTNLDTGNVSYCAASGATCGVGYSNAVAGKVTVIGGRAATVGSTPDLYQLGHYGCNCWEGQWLGNWQNGPRLFGDCNDATNPSGISPVTYSAFWIR